MMMLESLEEGYSLKFYKILSHYDLSPITCCAQIDLQKPRHINRILLITYLSDTLAKQRGTSAGQLCLSHRFRGNFASSPSPALSQYRLFILTPLNDLQPAKNQKKKDEDITEMRINMNEYILNSYINVKENNNAD